MSNALPATAEAAAQLERVQTEKRRRRIQAKAAAYGETLLDDVYHDAKLTTNADIRRKAAELMLETAGAKARPQVDDTATLATINVTIMGSTISATATPANIDMPARAVHDVQDVEPKDDDQDQGLEPEHQNLLPPLDVDDLPQDINDLLGQSEGLA